MDELPLTFVLIALATLAVIFLLVATVLYCWLRRKRRRVNIDKVTVANSFSDNQSAYNKAGSTEFIQAAAGGKGHHRTTVTHVFQGPAVPKKTFEAPPPPKGPPSSVDQLSQATMSTERAKSPQSNLKTVVIVGDDDVPPPEPRHATPSPKPRVSLSPTPASNEPKPRDRSLRIDLPDGAPNNRLANYRALPKDSPLTVRKFPERMEKLQENENERLYFEFEMLNKSTPPLKPATVAESHENIRKNRFYDILPFDENRVILQYGRGNYINASYVKDEKTGAIRYIAAQGPIGDSETVGGRRDATVVDFWRMMWDENVNCVVMLTQCVEGHRQKCAVYWPENAGETVHIDGELTMNLYCITEDDICFQREIWLEKQGHAKRKVVQWHYKEWRDAAGPQDAENLLTFMELVRASDKKYPLLVHCSAGVGRTGVFIALDILLDKLAAESIIDVYETVSRLRQTRVNMVQSGEQYITLYEVIALAIRKRSASSEPPKKPPRTEKSSKTAVIVMKR